MLTRIVIYVAVLIIGFGAVKLYGNRRYENGKTAAVVEGLDQQRARVKHALDSAARVMRPTLDSIMAENDSLRSVARSARIVAANALIRAKRAEQRRENIDPGLLEQTPPEVRLLIDSLTISHDSLVVNLERMIAQNAALEKNNTKLGQAVGEWQKQAETARGQITADETEIAVLKKQKTPPKIGFKTGFVAGALAVIGTIVAVGALAH